MNSHAQRPLVRNASSEKQVTRAGQSADYARTKADDRLRQIMERYDGRWWMWDHLAALGPFASIFVTSSEIYYRAGRQDAAHELIADITRVCPDLFVQMQHENITRETAKHAAPTRTENQTTEDEDDGN